MPAFKQKISHVFFTGLLCFGLFACESDNNSLVTSDIPDLQKLEIYHPAGGAFSTNLATGYKDFALWLEHEKNDDEDARHFAHKGLFAAKARLVQPEPPENWDIPKSALVQKFNERSRLMRILDAGGRVMYPEIAAKAQLSYDCWLEERESKTTKKYKSGQCFEDYQNAMASLESNISPADIPGDVMSQRSDSLDKRNVLSPIPVHSRDKNQAETKSPESKKIEEIAKTPLEPDETKFLLFFEFDSAEITKSGHKVLKAASQKISKNDKLKEIFLTGHADTVGTEKYNQNLGLRRAKSVKEALKEMGLDIAIKIKSMGEKELLVQTKDGVKEPANRRVEIDFVK